MEQNPSVIQPCGHGLPLVLIHDGGGTTCSYYSLKSLGRPVYGIHNPRFYSCRQFNGGIVEMANIYIQLIELINISGPFIIGGWSLGGLIALEITKTLGAYPYGPVAGTVMIDTPCPALPSVHITEQIPYLHNHSRMEIKFLVHLNMKVAAKMVEKYKPPLHATDWEYADEQDCTLLDKRFMPYVVLLRAQERVQTFNITNGSTTPSTRARVDYFRDSTALGWERAEQQIISKVLPIPGNHFDIFMEGNIDSTSESLQVACDTIEMEICLPQR
ncbi:hypothetical protein DRE_07229 [Drechslerella stenobrocha 248]|uniref:Thioesterase domain-containing protein n=1 Tax=Drechslerella stenobrocha 248 TaxID=1043628 RepID=W7HLW9_9PEZI|nr:hypothetical protein DRE_07229 [Drechslerella stenobrocha 248]